VISRLEEWMVEMGHTFKVSNAAERKEKFAIMEKKMKECEENIRKLQMEQNALKTQIKKIEDEKKKQALKI